MSLTDLAYSASKSGEVTSVWRYDFDSTYAVWWCQRTDTVLGTCSEGWIQL